MRSTPTHRRTSSAGQVAVDLPRCGSSYGGSQRRRVFSARNDQPSRPRYPARSVLGGTGILFARRSKAGRLEGLKRCRGGRAVPGCHALGIVAGGAARRSASSPPRHGPAFKLACTPQCRYRPCAHPGCGPRLLPRSRASCLVAWKRRPPAGAAAPAGWRRNAPSTSRRGARSPLWLLGEMDRLANCTGGQEHAP